MIAVLFDAIERKLSCGLPSFQFLKNYFDCCLFLYIKTRVPGIKKTIYYIHAFFPFGNRTGDASAAIACNEWKVDPIRNHSLVPSVGARLLRGR